MKNNKEFKVPGWLWGLGFILVFFGLPALANLLAMGAPK